MSASLPHRDPGATLKQLTDAVTGAVVVPESAGKVGHRRFSCDVDTMRDVAAGLRCSL